jgi:hypothetical protein
VLVLSLSVWASAQTVQMAGKVVDENGVIVIGAKLTFSLPGTPIPVIAITDEAGRFLLPPLPAGTYELRVEKPGFYVYLDHSFALSQASGPIEIVLNHQREFGETVNVVYSPPVIDPQQVAAQNTLHAEEIIEMPYPSTHDFRSALPLLPGVVRDNLGQVHLNGGAEDQAYYSLDGFNIGNPVSGTLQNRVSVDSLRKVTVESSRYSAEFGKGSAGLLALETSQGDDRFRFMATNFLPSLQVNKKNLDIDGWTPRANFSGPIVKGRAWFFNAADIQYDLSVVNELPPGADTASRWQGSDLTRFQVNLTNRNILTSGFLFNFTNANHFGLSPLDPLETTRDVTSRYYFLNVKDQTFLAGGTVLEVGVAASRLNGNDQAMGDIPYVISPEGNSGNYFADSQQTVDHVQAIASLLLRPLSWHGRHDVKFGIDVDDNTYRQFSIRRSFEVNSEQGIRIRTVSFSGNPSLSGDDAEFSAYIQDRWTPQERLLIETGLRLDWDQILGDVLFSPRLALTYSPSRVRNSKFSAGIGVFYDATNLGLLARGLDQTRTDTFYSEDGSEIVAGPIVSQWTADRASLQAPFSLNWSVGWEQKLPKAVYFATNFIRRNGRHAWAYSLTGSGEGQGAQEVDYQLDSSQIQSYYYLEFTAKRMFKEKFYVVASYARSSSRTSAVIDFSLENPIFSQQASGPVGWDVPNRFITWGLLPVPHFRKWTAAYFLEWHTGFPYSVVDQELRLVGAPNSYRYPDYFSLNLQFERRFRLLHYEWALRVGFNNITGHDNPTAVYNNIDSPNYGQFAGGSTRAFVGRIRFLGKI